VNQAIDWVISEDVVVFPARQFGFLNLIENFQSLFKSIQFVDFK
jgi:hypothetical protein